ncbi:MAG: hypothetical protein M3Q68_09605 [Actinomycetota bacterium]|nr:hypothetical protein [Actinomycetota bacterium]
MALPETIGREHLENLDRMRRTRHASEYEERPLSEAEVRVDLGHAEAIVSGVQRTIFPPEPPPPAG